MTGSVSFKKANEILMQVIVARRAALDGLQNRPARGQRGVPLAKYASALAHVKKTKAFLFVFTKQALQKTNLQQNGNEGKLASNTL